jgi:hypothetical protein
MSTETLIYKYPNIKHLFESNLSINPIYLNPHADIIEFTLHNPVNPNWLSRHSSNMAVEILTAQPELIRPQIVFNDNPKIEPLLEIVKSKFTSTHWSQMSSSTNPAILRFLEKHPENIDWNNMSGNECAEAIRILEKNQDKIVWWILSLNISAIEILQNNPDKIDWWNLCKNHNPKAIEMVEQILQEDPSKIELHALSTNPNAIHIISQNLEEMDSFFLSLNPKAMDILIEHPELIDFDNLLLNPSAIPYLETQMERFTLYEIKRLTENPNCLPLIQKMLDAGMIPDEDLSDILDCLFRVHAVYELDYQAMNKVRAKNLYPEIIQSAFHPSRVAKWLDYHCENGGDVDDFEL